MAKLSAVPSAISLLIIDDNPGTLELLSKALAQPGLGWNRRPAAFADKMQPSQQFQVCCFPLVGTVFSVHCRPRMEEYYGPLIWRRASER